MNENPVGRDAIGEEFVRLLIEHEPRVRAFLRGLLPSWADVDEVIQEASLVAWRKFSDFERGTAFGGWFLTIARFEALKHREKFSRSPLVFSQSLWDIIADESEEDDSRFLAKQLESCLQQLAPDKRELLLHVHSPGVVMRESAKASGKGEQAFYKLVQRLRRVVLDCVSRLNAAEGYQ